MQIVKNKNIEKVLPLATLVFPRRKSEGQIEEILLGKKKRGIGRKRWNGYGGGTNGQPLRIAACRELKEENTMQTKPEDLEKVAILYCHNTKRNGTMFTCVVHVYFTRYWRGAELPTREMSKPTWYTLDSIPYKKMMPADKDWLPLCLAGKKLIAHIHCGPYQKRLTAPTEIEIIQGFDKEEPTYHTNNP